MSHCRRAKTAAESLSGHARTRSRTSECHARTSARILCACVCGSVARTDRALTFGHVTNPPGGAASRGEMRVAHPIHHRCSPFVPRASPATRAVVPSDRARRTRAAESKFVTARFVARATTAAARMLEESRPRIRREISWGVIDASGWFCISRAIARNSDQSRSIILRSQRKRLTVIHPFLAIARLTLHQPCMSDSVGRVRHDNGFPRRTSRFNAKAEESLTGRSTDCVRYACEVHSGCVSGVLTRVMNRRADLSRSTIAR